MRDTQKKQKKEIKNEKKKMSTDMKVFFGIVAAVVIGIIVLVVIISKPKDVAVIDNNKVTLDEFRYYFSQNQAYAIQQSGTTDAATYLNSTAQDGSGTVKDVIKRQTLNEVVQIELLLLKVKEDRFKVADSEIQQIWLSFKNSLSTNAQNNEMTLEEYAKGAFGVSLNTIQSIYRDYIVTQKYFIAESEKIKVTDAELSTYYKDNKSFLDRASIAHILISCAEDASAAVVAEKKKLAEDILARVNKGEDFAALAKQYSEDTGSKDSGGVYEIQPNGQMVAEFQNWAFSHKAGDTGIVRTTYGFHVMKLNSILNTLASQKEVVLKACQMSNYQKSIDTLMQGTEYNIQIKEGYGDF